MRGLEIEKGSTESKPYPLATFSIATVYAPATDEGEYIAFHASHDGKDYGAIYRNELGQPILITLQKVPTVHIFDPDDFEGIQFVKLVSNKPVSKTLIFPIHFTDS